MKAPAVTVLLPAFNAEATIASSIESILAQTFRSFELLIIDDGSADDTVSIISAINDPRIRLIRNESNLGLMRTLNRGLAEAKAPLIARQDADDLSVTHRLERQVKFLRENPSVAMVGSSCWRMDPTGRLLGVNDMPCTHHAIRWASIVDNPFIHTSVIFRRNIVFDQLGGYNADFPICEDYELRNRIAAKHQVANLRERLVAYREMPTSMMQSQPEKSRDAMRKLLEVNFREIFPGRSISAEELDLLSLFRLRFGLDHLAPLVSLLSSLESDFRQRYEGIEATDLDATRCRQDLRLAYKFLGSAKREALQCALRGFRRAPFEAIRQVMLVVTSGMR